MVAPHWVVELDGIISVYHGLSRAGKWIQEFCLQRPCPVEGGIQKVPMSVALNDKVKYFSLF